MGGGGIAPPFLTSALDGGERPASRSCRFTPRNVANHMFPGMVPGQAVVRVRPQWREVLTLMGKKKVKLSLCLTN
jgi:hypothetical protein